MKKTTELKRGRFISGIVIAAWAFSLVASTDSTASKINKKKLNYLIVPIFYIEPETGFGAGGNASCYHTFAPAQFPSMLNVEVSGTQHNQFIGTINAELYPGRMQWYSSLASKIQKYPDVFYGIGNSTAAGAEEGYTRHAAEMTLTGQRYLGEHARAGGSFWLNRERISGIEPGGLLDRGSITGSSRYSFLAMGPRITYDTRNSIYLTHTGWYADALVLGTFSGLTSDRSFGKCNLDCRHFHPLTKSQTIGIQAVVMASFGTVPFQVLPGIGEVLRGYTKSRYRDRNLFALQAEHSFVIWKKLRGGAFGGMGDVFNARSDLSFNRLKMAAGGGLRYVFTPDGVSIRVDYAVSRRDGGQLYVTAKDAF
jgi:hypothetical protein